MATIIMRSLATFLAIYGLVQLIRDIVNFFFDIKNKNEEDVVVVIKVKNSAESLEAAVRTVIWKSLSCTNGGKVPDILIVDLGSDDETAQIANKLCADYSFIYYTTEELYNKAKGTNL